MAFGEVEKMKLLLFVSKTKNDNKKFLFTSHQHWRHDGRLISMEVRSFCLKVGWDDAIATIKPNHNFFNKKIKKLQKNDEGVELLIIFHAIGNKRNFLVFREEEEDEGEDKKEEKY